MKIYNTNINNNVNVNLKANIPKEAIETLKGKIIEVDGDNVIISTPSGELIEAKLDSNVLISKNVMIDFLVKYSDDNKMILTPTSAENKEVSANTKNLFRFILKQNLIPVNEKNMDIVKQLVDNKMPIDKESIENVSKYVDKLEILSSSDKGEKIMMLFESADITIEDIKNFIKVKNTPVSKQGEQDIEKQSVDITSKNTQNTNNSKNDVTSIVKNILNGAKILANNKSPETSFTKAVVMLLKMDMKINLENLKIYDEFVSNEKGFIENEIKELIELTDKNTSTDNMKDAEDKNKNNTKAKLDNTVSKENNNSNTKEISKTKAIIRSFIKTLKSLTGSKSKNNIDDMLKTLKSAVKEFEGVNQNPTIKTAIEGKLKAIEQKMVFVNNLNESYNVVYIPVEMDFEDLKYRFALLKKNRTLTKKEADFYITVHTKNLNKIEVMCKMIHKKIEVKFFTEDEGAANLLADNKSILYNHLKEDGFENIDLITANKIDYKPKLFDIIGENKQTNFLFDVRV
ncbi:flagellar hook-length control protein FliK [Clostridiaceae bacterium M8S5]|nr:flagellar hook-length control protein FliK [Clostridiaceae bacterium M8S5]